MRDREQRRAEYLEKLRDPRWQRKRLEIMQRDKFRCVFCDDETKTLNVHHTYYETGRNPWEYPDFSLLTLCEPCHEAETAERQGAEQALIRALRICGVNWENVEQLAYAFEMARANVEQGTAVAVEWYDINALSAVIKTRGALRWLNAEMFPMPDPASKAADGVAKAGL